MVTKLSEDAATCLRLASDALARASAGAVDAAPTLTRPQNDPLANAVMAEIAAAEALMLRARVLSTKEDS